jgi:hypothetical protein
VENGEKVEGFEFQWGNYQETMPDPLAWDGEFIELNYGTYLETSDVY